MITDGRVLSIASAKKKTNMRPYIYLGFFIALCGLSIPLIRYHRDLRWLFGAVNSAYSISATKVIAYVCLLLFSHATAAFGKRRGISFFIYDLCGVLCVN